MSRSSTVPTADANSDTWILPPATPWIQIFADGYVSGDMCDWDCRVLSCPKCKHYHWVADIRTEQQLGEEEAFDNPDYEDLPKVFRLEHDEFKVLLSREFWNDAKQEKHIRIRAWWAFNMPYRESHTGFIELPERFELSEEQAENLSKLLVFLDADQDETIMKVEALREPGEFDACLKLLDQPFDEDCGPAIATIRELAKQKKRRVACFEVPDPVWD